MESRFPDFDGLICLLYTLYQMPTNKYLEKIAALKIGPVGHLVGAAVKDVVRGAGKAAKKLQGYAKDAIGASHLEYVGNALGHDPKDWKPYLNAAAKDAQSRYTLDRAGYKSFLNDAKKRGYNSKAMGKEKYQAWKAPHKEHWSMNGPDSARYKQIKGGLITGSTAYGVAKTGNRIYNRVKGSDQDQNPYYY